MTEIWQRFREASVLLAGHGPVKQRLMHAYLQHLAEADPDELIPELQGDFERLVRALTSAQACGVRGSVEASVLKMSEAEAGRHGASIVMMFATLSSRATRAQAGRQPTQLRAVSNED
jgi:hypothetical protein